MCNCFTCDNICPCNCHEWNHFRVIGGTRNGKTTLLLEAMFRTQHPNGVVQGEVVTDSGEIEA